MKLKKSKASDAYNCRIYIENDEVHYTTRHKEYRIQFDDAYNYNWCKGWFVYKNLELNLDSLPAVYIYIL